MGDDELLALALSRPNEAMVRARAMLAADPGPLAASVAHQVIGLVLREFGDIDAAVAELRIARTASRRAIRSSATAASMSPNSRSTRPMT